MTSANECRLCGSGRTATALSAQGTAVLRCAECGLLFRSPYTPCGGSRCAACPNPCIARLDDDAMFAARMRVDARRAERIASLCGGLSGLRVLELGTGIGCLGNALCKQAAYYRGVESSPVFHEALKARFPELAEKVAGTALPGPQETGFDMIVAVDVLQFTPFPQQYLAEAARALKPGGFIYIEVPNESRLPARARMRKLLGLYKGEPVNHGHINFFTPRSLRASLQKAGLAEEKLFQTSIAGDEDRLFLTLKRPLPLWVSCASLTARLTRLDLLLGLGNTVCLCRKPA